MSKHIEVHDEVFRQLQELAEPFVDDPNSVIVRLLDFYHASGGKVEQQSAELDAAPTRAAKGEVTTQLVYERALLYVLSKDFPGRATKQEAAGAVVELLDQLGILKEIDKQPVSTGEMRAINATAWARNELKTKGLLKSNSPRGVWELSPAGRREAQTVTQDEIRDMAEAN